MTAPVVKGRVSILMPAYNHAAYVDQALASIDAQDYPDLEVVAIDDGSRDATFDRLRAWAGRTRHKAIVLRQENQGLIRTLERAFATASGEYIGFLASDDWLAPGKVAAQVRDLEALGADAAYGSITDVWASGRQASPGAIEFTERWDPDAFIAGLVTGHGPMLQAGLFRRSVLDAAGGIDQGFPQEDWPLQIEVARRARRVVVRREPVVFYRHHPQNMVRTRSRELMRWKMRIARKYTRGSTRRRACAIARALHARDLLPQAPWRALAHYSVARVQAPRTLLVHRFGWQFLHRVRTGAPSAPPSPPKAM